MFISYGFNNRTQMLRIPGAGRIEDRTVDGSCNPYLAATAVLAAGLDGIENGLDAGRPDHRAQPARPDARTSARSSAWSCCPANLLDATRELEQDDVLRAALGKARSEDYVDYYVKTSRTSSRSAHNEVTQWEIKRYLQLF